VATASDGNAETAALWRALERAEQRMVQRIEAIERQLEDEEMAEAIKSGVQTAMRGKVVVPVNLLTKVLAILLALVTIAGGIKGLIP
jgi:hypothetical protein